MNNNTDNKNDEQVDVLSEVHLGDSEEPPVINIVIDPDLQNSSTFPANNVPLFIRKLWKIVNDESNVDIIGWNHNGDGFILHDQLKFISETLPRYFKHNQLSSFVRQLNLYDFHKIQHVEKDEFQFSHPFFLKDLPQLLPLIKRKTQTGRQKANATESAQRQEPSPEVTELMTVLKEIKNKSDVVTNEMSKLRQENAALWGEMNSLRLKYSKQTKVINKLIHFLIAYMQKHHHSRKSGRTVSTTNSNKYLKTGPKIMELDYRYKNNPHEFWTDFDNQQDIPDHNEQEAYTVVEPAETNTENDLQPENTANSPNMRVSSAIEEILPSSNAFNQLEGSPTTQAMPQFNYTTSHPSSSKSSKSALQRSRGSKENVGYLIDNSRVEMNTIKELFKNLTPEDMSTFYKLVNENYKNQEDVSVESEKDLTSLAQMIPQDFNVQLSEEDLNNIIEKQGLVGTPLTPSEFDDIIQQQTNNMPTTEIPPNTIQEAVASGEKMDETSLDIISDDLLNTDELLNDVSVDQYFNID